MLLSILNNDCLHFILIFLADWDIARFGQCSKQCCALYHESKLWQHRLESKFGIINPNFDMMKLYQWYRAFPIRFEYFWSKLHQNKKTQLSKVIKNEYRTILRFKDSNQWSSVELYVPPWYDGFDESDIWEALAFSHSYQQLDRWGLDFPIRIKYFNSK